MSANESVFLLKEEAIEWARQQGVQLPEHYYGYKFAQAHEAALGIGRMAVLDQIQAIFDRMDMAEKKGMSFAQWQGGLADESRSTEIPRIFLEITLQAYIQIWYQAGRCWALTTRAREIGRTDVPVEYLAVNSCKDNEQHARFHGRIQAFDHPWWKRSFPPNGLGCHCVVVISDGHRDLLAEEDVADDGWDFSVCDEGPMTVLQKDAEARLSYCCEPRSGPIPPLRLPDAEGYPLPMPSEKEEWSPAQQAVHGLVTQLTKSLGSPVSPEYLLELCLRAKSRDGLGALFAEFTAPLLSPHSGRSIESRFVSMLENGLFSADVFGYVTAYRNEY